MTWRRLMDDIRRRCAPYGLDLARPFRLDDLASMDGRAPSPGAGAARWGVLLGNTRALWAPFTRWLAEDERRLTLADPLEAYVERAVAAAFGPIPVTGRVRFAHDPPPDVIPIQRLASACGLARVSPGMLCVHHVHGPWIALRAAVTIDVEGPPDAPLAPPPDPCAGCSEPCVPLLRRALETPGRVEDDPRVWMAVRLCCPAGREHAYDEPQLLYHYTKDRGILASEVQRVRAGFHDAGA